MKDEKLIKYLSELAASARPRQLTDEEIAALLAAEPEDSSEKDENAWARFVETVLTNLRPDPVRSGGWTKTLGDFLKEAMEATNFTMEDVSTAIGKDVTFIEQILVNNPPLSSINPDDTAGLASLLRIHISVLQQMLPRLPPTGGMVGVSGFMTSKLRESDVMWLEAVRRELQHRNQSDLID